MKNFKKGSINLVLVLVIIVLGGVVGYFVITEKPGALVEEEKTSATETKNLSEESTLPPLVEAKKQEILKAVETRDYKILANLANQTEEYFKLNEVRSGVNTFDDIPKLFELPYGTQINSQRIMEYVWPGVSLRSFDKWTEEDVNIMRKLYNEETIEYFKKYYGGYALNRIIIGQDGNWAFYTPRD